MTQPDTKAEDELDMIVVRLAKHIGVAIKADDLATTMPGIKTATGIMSGGIAEAKAALQAHIQEEVRQKLDSIGQPLLTDIKGTPTPEEHQRQIEIIRWYESRIATLKGEPHD